MCARLPQLSDQFHIAKNKTISMIALHTGMFLKSKFFIIDIGNSIICIGMAFPTVCAYAHALVDVLGDLFSQMAQSCRCG